MPRRLQPENERKDAPLLAFFCQSPVKSGRMAQTGEGNTKPLQQRFLPDENGQ